VGDEGLQDLGEDGRSGSTEAAVALPIMPV